VAPGGFGWRTRKETCMTSPAEIREKFWKAVKSDRTVMLGLTGVEDGMSQPMTAQLMDGADEGPIYIFTAKDTDLAEALGERHDAIMHFADKGHDLFAAVHGQLIADNDRATIEKLWNPFVAAWFEGGKDDPNLQLLRFEPEEAKIWLNENSMFAGVKMLLGRDPKKDYQDKVAEVRL
jgi:general stress protein 26